VLRLHPLLLKRAQHRALEHLPVLRQAMAEVQVPLEQVQKPAKATPQVVLFQLQVPYRASVLGLLLK
jgi:hypothetical protein